MSTIIDQLVFDRTQADVDRVKTLKSKIMINGLSSLTTSEKTEYLVGMKGAYNYTDLNRVGQAVSYLKQLLTALPTQIDTYRESKGVGDDAIYDVPYSITSMSAISPKTDWVITDLPTLALMDEYKINLRRLRTVLPSSSAPSLPNMQILTYNGANAIEQMLYMVYQRYLEISANLYSLVDRAALGTVLSDEVYSGEI